jgi:hypothetical protein
MKKMCDRCKNMFLSLTERPSAYHFSEGEQYWCSGCHEDVDSFLNKPRILSNKDKDIIKKMYEGY